jgi:GTPase Era involved in 16S rRNA processing
MADNKEYENAQNREQKSTSKKTPSGLNQLRSYTQTKLDLADSLRIIRNSFSILGREDAENQCKELIVKLAEDRFTLAVLGQFKRGKSSLMNAIIGKEILPTGVLPLTSAITILKYGPVEKLIVNRDGSLYPTQASVSELAEYVTEKGNPQNVKKLKSATLEIPESFLRYGIEFVDTPGVGSAITANTETTYQFLPDCDAVLFVTGMDTPMTNVELEFLQKIKDYVNRIFFVVNKIDLAKDDEQKEIMSFVTNTIRTVIYDGAIKIFPVSSKLGLEGKKYNHAETFEKSGLKALQDELAVFLTQEKSSTLLSAVSQKILRIVKNEAKQNIFSEEFLQKRRIQIEENKTTRLKRDPYEATSLISSCAKKVEALHHSISKTGATETAGGEEFSLQAALPTPEKAEINSDEEISQMQVESKDVAENLQTRNCPVCEYTANQLFDYFVHWQYKLSIDENARQQFADQSGFCPLHIWQLLSISSPFGASLGYSHFAERLAQKLRSPQTDIRKLIPDVHDCKACEYLKETEEKYLQQLPSIISTEDGVEMYRHSQGLCLRHLAMLLNFASPEIHSLLLEHSIQRFEQDAEDMRTFALKNDALRRGLQNANERDAYRRTILRFASDKRVLTPWAEDADI